MASSSGRPKEEVVFKDLQKKVEDLEPALQKVLDSGFYTKEVTVLGTIAKMHVLVKDEIIEVNSIAGRSQDIMTRQHLLNIWAVCHATSEAAGIAFKTPDDAYKFFSLMPEAMFDHWFKAYQDLVPKAEEQIKALLSTAKKSRAPREADASTPA